MDVEKRIQFSDAAPVVVLRSLELVSIPANGALAALVADDAHELLIVLDGQGDWSVEQSWVPAARGACLLLPPQACAQAAAGGAQPLQLCRLRFDVQRDEARVLERVGTALFEPATRLDAQVQRLHAEAAGGGEGPLQAFHQQLVFQQLLVEFLQRRAAEGEASVRRAVERTIAHMHRSYTDALSIGELAADAGLSRWQYGAAFKALTGRTPVEYLTELRMNKAKALLLAPSSRVGDVARSVGFRDEYYFSRRFKQTTGLTPSAYVSGCRKLPRIFSIQYIGELLALGIRPVATNLAMLDIFQEWAYGIPGIPEPLGSDEFKELERLRLELIVFPSFAPRRLVERLSGIAPAVEISWRDDVYARLRRLGELFGRTGEADAWIMRYEAKAEQARARLAGCVAQGESASAFVYADGALHVYAGHHFGHTLYQGLGFAQPEGVRQLTARDAHTKWKRIAAEQLDDYAGDRVFLALPQTGVDAAQGRALLNSPVWQSLGAVRRGQAYVVDDVWGNYNPITLERHLDEMVRLLRRHARL